MRKQSDDDRGNVREKDGSFARGVHINAASIPSFR